MVERQQHAAPTIVCAIADHLDMVLAATEDLLQLGAGFPDAAQLLRLELGAITHVLQARQRMQELQFPDAALALQSAEFIARTDAFEAKAAAISGVGEHMAVTGDYLIGRRISIAALIGLAAALLDALESYYVLYEPTQDDNPIEAPAPPPEVWSSVAASV